MLEIVTLMLGPVSTNCYLIADSASHAAAVVDPAWDGRQIASEAVKRNWQIEQIWITHAHFDHIGGVGDLAGSLQKLAPVALHPDDRPLWDAQGGAALFGYTLPPSPAPTLALAGGMSLQLGGIPFKVLHTPGHTPGHCSFYCADAGVCFCGDLIFQDSVGRTDLPGGDWTTLLSSIHRQIFTLPDGTRLLSGHGPETTVGMEKKNNPFLNG